MGICHCQIVGGELCRNKPKQIVRVNVVFASLRPEPLHRRRKPRRQSGHPSERWPAISLRRFGEHQSLLRRLSIQIPKFRHIIGRQYRTRLLSVPRPQKNPDRRQGHEATDGRKDHFRSGRPRNSPLLPSSNRYVAPILDELGRRVGFLSSKRPGVELHRLLISPEAALAMSQVTAEFLRSLTGLAFGKERKLVGS